MDGGVTGGNNPIFTARSEFEALKPNDAAEEPDLLMNLGTGSVVPYSSNSSKARPILDAWFVRLPRAYLKLLRGDKAWNDYMSVRKAEDKSRSYRLDINLPRSLSLDDVTSIPMLKSLVYKDKDLYKTIKEITSRLFATLFYFELTELPVRSGSRLVISGRIMCTRKADDKALPAIFQRLRKSTFYLNGRRLTAPFGTNEHGNLLRTISFCSGETIMIDLREQGGNHSFPLSGSPYNVSKLISQGGLRACFGTALHKRKAVDEPHRRPARKRKLMKAHGFP